MPSPARTVEQRELARIAAALERIADAAEGRPAQRERKPSKRSRPPQLAVVDDVSRARAKAALRRAGLA